MRFAAFGWGCLGGLPIGESDELGSRVICLIRVVWVVRISRAIRKHFREEKVAC